jgi:hypothetical protein
MTRLWDRRLASAVFDSGQRPPTDTRSNDAEAREIDHQRGGDRTAARTPETGLRCRRPERERLPQSRHPCPPEPWISTRDKWVFSIRSGLAVSSRQSNGEFGELDRLALNLDCAAVLLGHNVIADRQSETGALAGRLGREERLEQLVLDLRRDASAVVTHPDLDRVAGFARCYCERRAE